MPILHDIEVQTRSKEVSPKASPALRCTSKMMEDAVDGEAFFGARRRSARSLVECIGMRLWLEDLQRDQGVLVYEPEPCQTGRGDGVGSKSHSSTQAKHLH